MQSERLLFFRYYNHMIHSNWTNLKHCSFHCHLSSFCHGCCRSTAVTVRHHLRPTSLYLVLTRDTDWTIFFYGTLKTMFRFLYRQNLCLVVIGYEKTSALLRRNLGFWACNMLTTRCSKTIWTSCSACYKPIDHDLQQKSYCDLSCQQ